MSRLAGLTGILVLVTLAACATTNPLDDDGGVGDRPDATKSTADADPMLPDAMGRPDAAEPDAAEPPDAAVPHPDATPGTPDAAPVPDAAPPPPDAAPPPPDAAVPHPDASTGCTTSTMNLLSNASFDTGPGTVWTETGSAGELILATSALMGHTPHSGGFAAWIGGYLSGTDTLTQSVAVPAGTTAIRFKGQRWVETEETDADVYDKLFFQVLGPTGTTVKEYIGGTASAPVFSDNSATTAWTAFDFPVTGSYAGQTIRLRISGSNDGFFATSWFLDTLTLEATVCQ